MHSQISNLKSDFLNIICFDVPFPADYGGAIEEFYKIKSLHAAGVKIYLHCFVYSGRTKQKELEKYCEQVFYYERKRTLKDFFSGIPFIVKTRMHQQLLHNLLSNNFPILFDGTHTTGFLNHPDLKERKKLVRLHNIEWIYYRVLFDSAYALKEKLFFYYEYKKLRAYDKKLEHADFLSCLSQTDADYYREKFPDKKISLEYVFHENETVSCLPGNGSYILYHGNLSLLDNYQIIIQLLANELSTCKHQIVIAGKNPDKTLVEFVKNRPTVNLVPNPSAAEMDELILNAHICLAVAKNSSGVKLKLINSLFKARFVVSDEQAIHGCGLEELCFIPQDELEFPVLIDKLMQQTFTGADIQQRKNELLFKYDNKLNALKILNAIFNHYNYTV